MLRPGREFRHGGGPLRLVCGRRVAFSAAVPVGTARCRVPGGRLLVPHPGRAARRPRGRSPGDPARGAFRLNSGVDERCRGCSGERRALLWGRAAWRADRRQPSYFCCLWSHGCSGRRRARPPARSPHASLRLGVVDLEARPCPPDPPAPSAPVGPSRLMLLGTSSQSLTRPR